MRSIIVTLLVFLALGFGTRAVCADTISDDFDAGLSPQLWSRYVQPGAYDPWEIDAPDWVGRLVIAKLADAGTLNETLHGGVQSNFSLVGDFTVRADFDLWGYPNPGGGYNEALLEVRPANLTDNFAMLKFSYSNDPASYQERFEGWTTPPAVPFGAFTDPTRSGTFELRRVGQTMSAWLDRGSGMELIGSYADSAFSGPMTVRMYAAQVVRSSNGVRSFSHLDIRFDNFQATADTIVPEPGTMLLLTSGLVGLTGFIRRRMK